jgi:hypothetical protein
MSILSIFQNTYTPVRFEPLPNIIHKIRKGRFSDLVSLYRHHLVTPDRLQARLTRRQIPTFSPSGHFNGVWSAHALVSYSHLILLETEPLPPAIIPYYRRVLQQDPLTHACFIAATGCALCLLVRTDGTPATHHEVFYELKYYFSHLLHTRFLDTGDDLLYLCHFSSDPDAFLNPDSGIYSTSSIQPTIAPSDQHRGPFPSLPTHTLILAPASVTI